MAFGQWNVVCFGLWNLRRNFMWSFLGRTWKLLRASTQWATICVKTKLSSTWVSELLWYVFVVLSYWRLGITGYWSILTHYLFYFLNSFWDWGREKTVGPHGSLCITESHTSSSSCISPVVVTRKECTVHSLSQAACPAGSLALHSNSCGILPWFLQMILKTREDEKTLVMK